MSFCDKTFEFEEYESGILIHGDAKEVLPQIQNLKVDLVLIDPPYNIGKDSWDDYGITKKGYAEKKYEGPNYYDLMIEIFGHLVKMLKNSGSFWFFHNDFKIMAELDRRLESDLNMEQRNFIVWNKLFEGSSKKDFLEGFVKVEGLRKFQKMCEYILFYTKADLHKIISEERKKRNIKAIDISKEILSKNGNVTGWFSNIETGKNVPTEETIKPITKYLDITLEDIVPKFNNKRTHHSVWNYDFDHKKVGHLTPKPIKLLENIIVHCTDENDIVLDSFGGSGSTAIAAIRTGRKFILIEKEEEYYHLSKERIHNETNTKK